MDQDFSVRTRIVITGTSAKTSVKLLLHILQFTGKEIDFITDEEAHVGNSDFILFEAHENILTEYRPNIALITGINDSKLYQEFISSVISGGIVIYNQEDIPLVHIVENSDNHFRKIPYKNPETERSGEQLFVRTDLGEIPVQAASADDIYYIEGVKHLAQQLGIMETEFYESLLDYRF